jgi:homocysteine S-methyltransferase
MLEPFLEYLDDRVLVCDGAMGTQLYAKGVFLNQCFDELCLSRPALVKEVHQEYLWAGAQILETNTFGANPIKLEPHGLIDRVRDINVAGVQLAREIAGDKAYVAGSVGPLGIRIEPYGKVGIEDAKKLFAGQVEALAAAGADLLSLETFVSLRELQAAMLAAKDVCDLPIVVQVTVNEEGVCYDGTPPEKYAPKLEQWGADVVGINCGVGPQIMLETIERMSKSVSRAMVVQPNAGKPRVFEGRSIYLSSPAYLASYVRKFIQAGVQIVGGCCGTTPAHIRAMREATRSLTRQPRKRITFSGGEASPPPDVIQLQERSSLAKWIHESRFLKIVDVIPPRGNDATLLLNALRKIRDRGVNALCVSSSPRGSVGMDPLSLSLLVQREVGLETILHCGCGDYGRSDYGGGGRSLHSMQSRLLGAYALGLRNLLMFDGDPLWIGEHLGAAVAPDVDTIAATRIVSLLNQGRDLGGNSIGRPTGFYVGVSVDPSAPDLEEEVRLLERKIEAGAHFAVSHPVFQAEPVERFLRMSEHCPIPLIAAVRPLTSFQEAVYLDNEVPDIRVPEVFVERMRDAGSPEEERAEGVAIARELIHALSGMVRGVEVMVGAGSSLYALELLDL